MCLCCHPQGYDQSQKWPKVYTVHQPTRGGSFIKKITDKKITVSGNLIPIIVHSESAYSRKRSQSIKKVLAQGQIVG